MSILQSLAITAPEVIMAIGVLGLLVIGVFLGNRSFRFISWATVALFVVAGLSLLGSAGQSLHAWNDLYVADAFSTYMKVIILVCAVVSVLMSISWLKHAGVPYFEYPVLIALASIGTCIMVSASSLLTLYIGLELLSLPSYVLASFHRENARSSEAGLKYFVLGALASGMLLYGISLLYGFAGSTNYDAVVTMLTADEGHSIGSLFGIVFVLAGIAFKIAAVPFHMWTPDVYEGAPTPVVAFFSSVPKAAAMALLLRVCFEAFGGAISDWRQVIIFMSVASMALGSIGAIGQKNVKRMLAYSAINNVGYMLIGVAAATPEGVGAVLFYLAIYVVMNLGAFVCISMLRNASGVQMESIPSMGGMVKTRPWLTFGFAILMFSLSGIPPLFGFMVKYIVFRAAIDAGLYWLAFLGVVFSVIAAFYYLRVVKVMLLDPPTGDIVKEESPVVDGALVAAAALFCSPLGYLLIGPLFFASNLAAASLF